MRIKKIIKNISNLENNTAYCITVDNPKHEVLIKGVSGKSYRIGQCVNFGIAYGQSSYGLSKGLGIDIKEAEKILADYFKRFPRVMNLILQAKNTIQRNYVVWSITKRKRRFPKYAQARKEGNWQLLNHMHRQAINSIIQSSAADIMKVQIRELAKVLPEHDAHMLMIIHDEIVCEVPENKAEEVLQLVKKTMENAIILKDVPIVAEGFISKFYKK